VVLVLEIGLFEVWLLLDVKSRLVINALLEQLGIFLMPDFQRLNG
jgi:hypothetical protein